MSNVQIGLSKPSLVSQLRALAAIVKKDFITFTRYPLSAISNILQPLIWLTPMYFMGKAFSTNGQATGFAAYTGSSDYMSFILIGAVISNFILTVFWEMGYALKNDMDAGVLEANWMAPLPRLLLLAGRTSKSLLVTTLTSAAMLALGALLFGFHPTGNVLAAVLTAVPMLLGLYGFGFAFASLVLILRDANTLVDVGSFLVQGFSGAQFPVTVLPRFLLPLALVLPITYGLDAIRGWMLHTKTILSIPAEIALLLVFMVVMLLIGSAIFAALERRVRRLGTLGQY